MGDLVVRDGLERARRADLLAALALELGRRLLGQAIFVADALPHLLVVVVGRALLHHRVAERAERVYRSPGCSRASSRYDACTSSRYARNCSAVRRPEWSSTSSQTFGVLGFLHPPRELEIAPFPGLLPPATRPRHSRRQSLRRRVGLDDRDRVLAEEVAALAHLAERQIVPGKPVPHLHRLAEIAM